MGHLQGTPGRFNFLWLELTGKCNLQCVHCYADSGPRQPLRQGMLHADWLTTIDDAAANGCYAMQLIGGEPTLYPELFDLVRHARAKGFTFIEVYTNATTLTHRNLSQFKEHGVRLACSFYSARADVHDRITKVDGSFERTISGIRAVVQEGIPLRVGIIELSEFPGEADSAQSFLAQLGVTEMGADAVRGVGRGASFVKQGDPDAQLCGACGRGQLAVDPTGTVFPCVFARHAPLGHVKAGFSPILEGSTLTKFRASRNKAFICGDSDETVECEPLGLSKPDHGCAPNKDGCAPLVKEINCAPLEEADKSVECIPLGGCTPDTSSCQPDRGGSPERGPGNGGGGCRPADLAACEPIGGGGPCRPDRQGCPPIG